ncbi:MAG: ABC transporter ATP-binding protein [Deltaproteobacteria bacterium]|nr:ABC transporter ATP-binding protein [Deltaproteobacteria bacterium]
MTERTIEGAGATGGAPAEPAAASRAPLLQVRDLRKVFVHGGKQLHVLRGVDFVIDRAEMVAIVGASGAGKSTLLHIVGTLDAPSQGCVEFDGRDVSRMDGRSLAAFRNRTIGFVFQFHHLLPEFNALENVMLPAIIGRMPRSEARSKAERLLLEVGLGERMTHRPSELSGGEQQRVAIARALVMEPRLLLADEPTGNIDSQTAAGIHELFFALNRLHGTTMIVVTHDDRLASKLPRRLEIRDGQIVQDTGGTLPVVAPSVPEAPAPAPATPSAGA